MEKAYFNWSSGKDSAMALHYAMKQGKYDVQSLFAIIKKAEGKIAEHRALRLIFRYGEWIQKNCFWNLSI